MLVQETCSRAVWLVFIACCYCLYIASLRVLGLGFDVNLMHWHVLLQGSPSPIEYRWAVLNTAGTWPEILRRYVMSRSVATMLHPLVSTKVSSTAAMLSSKCAHLLTAEHHLTLLR